MCSSVQEKHVIGRFPIEMWNGQVMKNLDLRVLGTECYVYIPKQFRKKFNKNVFGRMIGYLNYKDRYQVYVPSLKMHSHDVYFKSERVCTSPVVETGLENADVEDVAVENRQKGDTMLESSLSEKALEVKTEERPICIVKRPNVDDIGGLHSSVGTHC